MKHGTMESNTGLSVYHKLGQFPARTDDNYPLAVKWEDTVKNWDSHVLTDFTQSILEQICSGERLEDLWGLCVVPGRVCCVFSFISVSDYVGWENHMCGVSGTLAYHLTGLYLILIVMSLVSMGIFRAPQAGKGVWKGHRHCQASGSACVPGQPGKLSLALGHILSQGNSYEIMGGLCVP